jgi:cell division protease FtsH
MSSDSEEPRREREPKRPFNYQSAIWIGALAALAAISVALFFLPFRRETIDYPDFVRLIEQSARTESGDFVSGVDGSLIVERKDAVGERKLRYANLRDVVVGERAVTGVVDREVLEPQDAQLADQKNVAFVTAKSATDGVDRELQARFEAANFADWCWDDGPSPWSSYGPMLLMTAVFVGLFIFMIRRLGGAGSPMQFARSRGKLYAQEDLTVTFNDVAGVDEAVEEVREIVDFLKFPEKYQKLGGRIPKGVLLVGPPGTGKTLLAKAIAGEAGVPFFSLSGSDFVEMFVGVGAARVRDMFQQAEAKAPCILFIDELDALGKSRSGPRFDSHDEREQTLNALLVEMDGFNSNAGIIVIAATNRPEILDPALLRPGRFDRHVLVDRPGVRGREFILKVHVKNVKLAPDVELRHIAQITPGFAGADLESLVNEATLLAARKGKEQVSMAEFNEGVERVTAGLEKKQRHIDEEVKQRVACHEAGHALVAYCLPNTPPVHKVSIIPRGVAAGGYTMQRPEGDRYLMTKSELESSIQVLLGGTVAEEIVYADVSTGAQNDLERATDLAHRMVAEYGMSRLGRVNYSDQNTSPFLAGGGGREAMRSISQQTAREIDEEIRRMIDEGVERVRKIIRMRRTALDALTARLVEIETVDSDELKRIMDANLPGPLVVPGTESSHRHPIDIVEIDPSALDADRSSG